MPLSERFDVVGSISYVNLNIDPLIGKCHDCRVGVQEDGFGLALGMRSAISDRFEITADMTYISLSETGDQTGLNSGLNFNWSKRFSVGVFGSWGGVASYQAGARLYFR